LEDQWLMTRDGQTQFGPYTMLQLQQFAMEGRVSPDDHLWQDGMADWVPASSVLGTFLSPPLPLVSSPPPLVDGARVTDGNRIANRIATGVVAILWGWLGIHKFMLGLNTPGLIMLLTSLLTVPLTCGYGALVMGTIGIIEGVLYLTKTDAEFRDIYVYGKKPWF